MTPEVNARIASLRQLEIERGLTAEEMAEAIRYLREGRVAALAASAPARRAAAKAAIPTADEFLDGIL